MPVTPGTLPVAGHGTTIAKELDPTVSPGVFTTIPEVTSSIDFSESREQTEITPHASYTDSYILSQVRKRDDLPLDITYKFANAVHKALSDNFHNQVKFGIMIIGPEGAAPSTDTTIQSGELKTWKQMSPVRNGEYKVNAVFRPSGPFKYNGTLYV